MHPKRLCLLFALGITTASVSVFACLWDRDTLPAEKAAFPEVSYLITGTFPRHSREYYEWLRSVCEKRIQELPHRYQLYDDLAVAQHKLGDHKAAIETMHAKERIRPNLYETYSNLGTFLIYTGELDEARTCIEKALSINANAHFGREKYQLWLIEWALVRRKSPPGSQSEELQSWYQVLRYGFAAIVARHTQGSAAVKTNGVLLTLQQQAEAIRGISGMMRFADFDNPLLLEALGDVLSAGDVEKSGSKLIALSYLHASRKAVDSSEKQRLRKRFELLVEQRDQAGLEVLLDTGLAKGREYVESIRQDELSWIASGKDASAEFQKKYLPAK
ncbi:MAG: hypothetical protein U1F71_07125 [Verrucomicrobiaceae bacterium]